MVVNPGDYQRAVDALCLAEPYSDADVHKAADRYEEAHGIPLIRPGEEDEEGRPNEQFAKRLDSFDFTAADGGLMADPEVHRRALRKVLEIAKRKGLANLTQSERDGIHENQKALGLPLMDFSQTTRSPKAIVGDAMSKFKHIQRKSATYKERLAAVNKLEDISTLELFTTTDFPGHEKSEEVREAAMTRIQNLKLALIPE